MAEAKAVKQYLFVAPRDMNVTSTQGYSLDFKKGEPTHVPRAMHAEVMEKGVLPCDARGEIKEAPEPAEVDPAAAVRVMVAPEDGDERSDAILEAIKALVARNDAKDFSAGGIPSAAAVTHAVGWRADRKEIAAVWQKYKPQLLKAEARA
jgi:hypothetical protein